MELPRNAQSIPSSATVQTPQGGNVVVPGAAVDSTQTDVQMIDGDTSREKIAEASDSNGNTTIPAPMSAVSASVSEPAQK